MVPRSENLSIKYHYQTFFINCFLRAASNWTVYQKMWKSSVLVNLIKISVSVPNFSTESVGKPTIYDLLFLLTIYSPKMTISTFWNEKLAPEQALYHKRSFSALGTRQVENVDFRQISPKFYFAYNLSYKNEKSVKHRVIGSFFWSQWLIKDSGAQICTTRYE